MGVRNISAHYAFLSNGEFVKYPIITFNEEAIVEISSSNSLKEIAGLEFYSGVLFPYFFDKLLLYDKSELINHSSFKVPFVSKVVVPKNIFEKVADNVLLGNGKLVCQPSLITPMDGKCDCFPLIERINTLVEKGFFGNYSEAFQYYTSNGIVKSEIEIGAESSFVLCNNISFLNGGSISVNMFRVLR